MVWMFMYPSPPANSYVEILTAKTDGIGDRAFGMYLSHKNGTLMNQISAL